MILDDAWRNILVDTPPCGTEVIALVASDWSVMSISNPHLSSLPSPICGFLFTSNDIALGTFYFGPTSNFQAKETELNFETQFNRSKEEIFAPGDTDWDVSGIYNAIHEATEYVESRALFLP